MSNCATPLRPASLVLIAALIGCQGASNPGRDGSSDQLDAALFESTVARLATDSSIELRVDPRPLVPNPALASLSDAPYPGADQRAVAFPLHSDSAIERARADLLNRIRVMQTDALRDVHCPGASLPKGIDPDYDATRVRTCPARAYRSVAIALPRRGGPWWPLNKDERAAYAGREVYSVRVIVRNMFPIGSVEASWDYVFERVSQDRWSLIKLTPLLIVE
jgi:hypothetical protein